jgi:ribonuclease E
MSDDKLTGSAPTGVDAGLPAVDGPSDQPSELTGSADSSAGGATAPKKRRRRGSRGGRNRNRSAAGTDPAADADDAGDGDAGDGDAGTADTGGADTGAAASAETGTAGEPPSPKEPSRPSDQAPVQAPTHPPAQSHAQPPAQPVPVSPAVSQTAASNGSPQKVDMSAPLVPAMPPPRPKIGDTRPAPPPAPRPASAGADAQGNPSAGSSGEGGGSKRRRRNRGKGGGGGPASRPVEAVLVDEPVELDEETLERRRGRERKGRPVGRYMMVVHSRPDPRGTAGTVTQIAVLEGRALIEHYVSRPADDANQIDGNIYLGRVQNVLPGMEAAFIDIGTPKNAVLYRGDVRYDKDDIDTPAGDSGGPTRGRLPGVAKDARIEQLLKTGQTILCQVTKNPIGTKGARLTQEVSLPGRFVVLIPNSDTYGISKRLADDERKRLRRILDDVRPAGHGLIVRTAADGATADELRRDVARLTQQWERIDRMSKSTRAPALLYREPDMAVRVIREEFNRNYRGVVIDDQALYEEVRDYVASINPELADRVEWANDPDSEGGVDPLPVFERYHVHEQIHKALDRKVWLPSGGSLIIERTEALTVIDVNTGKNVGTSNLEETVFRNNLEAAEEIARQLRLRDIGGIIVIDFIDMEIAANRAEVIKTFRGALARDKTRTQVFDISELGLVEMTRKRISEGLVESFSETCPTCGGRGIIFDESLL